MDGRRERPVEDDIEKCDQSFVAAAGIVKGRAVAALDGENFPVIPNHRMMQKLQGAKRIQLSKILLERKN